jgi:hydrogenase expression/formation protein HypC
MSMGTVDTGGVLRTVCLDYVAGLEVGDHVIVHMGFAVNRITASEAADAFEAIGQIRDLSDLDLPERGPVGRESAVARNIVSVPDATGTP